MTEREAIKILEDISLKEQEFIKAFNKQIDKKVCVVETVNYEVKYIYTCPNCNKYLTDNTQKCLSINYCSKCGQKLDWSEAK